MSNETHNSSDLVASSTIDFKIKEFRPVLVCEFNHKNLIKDFPMIISGMYIDQVDDTVKKAADVLMKLSKEIKGFRMSLQSNTDLNRNELAARASQHAYVELARLMTSSETGYEPGPNPIYRVGSAGHAGFTKIHIKEGGAIKRVYSKNAPLDLGGSKNSSMTKFDTVVLWGEFILAVDIQVVRV